MQEGTEKSDATASASPTCNRNDGSDTHSIATNGEPEIQSDDLRPRSHVSSCEEEGKPDNPVPLSRISTEIGPAVVVPRLKRRGLLGQLTLVAEVEDPKTYPRKMKWFITFIVAVAGATAPMGSSIFFRTLISRNFYC